MRLVFALSVAYLKERWVGDSAFLPQFSKVMNFGCCEILDITVEFCQNGLGTRALQFQYSYWASWAQASGLAWGRHDLWTDSKSTDINLIRCDPTSMVSTFFGPNFARFW